MNEIKIKAAGEADVVVASDGVTPVSGAEVVIVFQAPVFSGQTVTAVSAANGSFEFTDVPVGDYRVTAASVSLAASAVGARAFTCGLLRRG